MLLFHRALGLWREPYMVTDKMLGTGLSDRLQALPQFVRFAIVGAAGLVVDVGVLLFCMGTFGVGPYWGRLVSYLCAATSTWYMNRRFTFVGQGGADKGKEWLLFVVCSCLAGILNYAMYALFVYLVGQTAWSPTVGVGLGACAGLLVNYTLSRRLVFRHSGGMQA